MEDIEKEQWCFTGTKERIWGVIAIIKSKIMKNL